MLGSDERLKLGFTDCLCQPARDQGEGRRTAAAAARRFLAAVALGGEQVQRVILMRSAHELALGECFWRRGVISLDSLGAEGLDSLWQVVMIEGALELSRVPCRRICEWPDCGLQNLRRMRRAG